MENRVIDISGYIRLLNNRNLKPLTIRGFKVTEILSKAVIYRSKGQSCTLLYEDMVDAEFEAVARKVEYIRANYPELIPSLD